MSACSGNAMIQNVETELILGVMSAFGVLLLSLIMRIKEVSMTVKPTMMRPRNKNRSENGCITEMTSGKKASTW